MMEAVYLLIGLALGIVLTSLLLARRTPPVVNDSAELNELLRELLHDVAEPAAVQTATEPNTDPDRVWVRFIGADGHTVAQKRLFRRSIHDVMPWGGASYQASEEDGDVLVYRAVA
jgi:hypothetical protein